jgi:hypothetical protein
MQRWQQVLLVQFLQNARRASRQIVVEQNGAGIPLQQCGEVQLFTGDEGGGHAGVEMSKREGAKKRRVPQPKGTRRRGHRRAKNNRAG